MTTGFLVAAVTCILLAPVSVAHAIVRADAGHPGSPLLCFFALCAVLCLATGAGCSGETAANTGPSVWAIGDGVKVNPVNGNLWSPDANTYGGSPTGGHREQNRIWDAASRTVRLRAARNEVAAFQIVVEGGGEALKGVQVQVTGDLGATVNLFRERYVPLGDQWYADPLIPFDLPGAARFDIPDPEWGVKGQSNQAVWVDLYVPMEAEPGRCAGELVVSAEGQPEVRLKVELEVIPVTLPADVHVVCDLNCYGNSIAAQLPGEDWTSPEYLALERSYFRLAHDHRSNLNVLPYRQSGDNHPGFAPELTGEGAEMKIADWSGYDAHFGPYFDGSAFEGCLLPARPVAEQYIAFHLCWPSAFEHYGTDRYVAENQAVARAYVAHAKEKGWTHTEFQVYYNEKPSFGYFPFEMDEPRTEKDLEALAYVSSVVRPALANDDPCRFVFRSDIYRYDFLKEKLGDKVDLFNVSSGIDLSGAGWEKTWKQTTGCYDVASLQEHQQRGGVAWFYGGAGKIDHSLLLNRRFAHRAWRWRADGFCVWCVDGWAGGDPWRTGTTGNEGFDFVYYPGRPVGSATPVPSLRLKAIRRGMQDYEYMWLLAQKLGSDKSAVDALLCDDQNTNPEAWDEALDRVTAKLLAE